LLELDAADAVAVLLEAIGWLRSIPGGIIAALDNHFAADADPPDRWRELKRRIVRMRDGLALVVTQLACASNARAWHPADG